jgi:RNA recognition motif-containing protein
MDRNQLNEYYFLESSHLQQGQQFNFPQYGQQIQQQQQQQSKAELDLFSTNASKAVFVRDLPFSCTSTDLRNFFMEMLQVPIKYATVCKNKKRRTLQFGCVLFESEEHAMIAVEKLNGIRFIGRDIRYVHDYSIKFSFYDFCYQCLSL